MNVLPLLVALATPVHAGQITYVKTNLADLSVAADVIVEAVMDRPPTGTESLPVAADIPGKCDPYLMKTYNLTVVSVVKDKVGLKATKGKMTVKGGNAFELVEVARKNCLGEGNQPPLFKRYGEKRSVAAGERMLFFMTYRKDWGFELAATWGFEEAAKKGKVAKYVARSGG